MLTEFDKQKAAANTETPVQREASEEPGITALPEPDIPDMDPSVSKTPRKNRPGALNLVPESYEDAVPTFRSYLEAKKEKKLMKMLATDVPMTPPAVSFEESPDTLTYDSSTSITNLLKGGKESAGSRSPKKKFLGLNISVPSFMSSNLDISEVPASQLMPPPKAPTSGPSSLSRRRATEKPIKPEQEDTTSHLPSKVRELRTLYDATSPVSDSPTLGRPPATTNRSVSDGVTREWEKEARDREREAEDDKLKRSKSVRHSDPSGSPPPTPPAKNTPPKTSAAETQDFDAAKDTPTISIESPPEKPVPVRSVNNLRNNYIDLIQKAPSMYSLHGDIQHLQVSHSAGVLGYSEHAQQMGEDEDEDEDEDDNQPHVSESRWSEGQLQQWKLQQKAHQKQHARFLQGDRPAPAFYSPSIYSVAFSPKPDGNDAKNVRFPILDININFVGAKWSEALGSLRRPLTLLRLRSKHLNQPPLLFIQSSTFILPALPKKRSSFLLLTKIISRNLNPSCSTILLQDLFAVTTNRAQSRFLSSRELRRSQNHLRS